MEVSPMRKSVRALTLGAAVVMAVLASCTSPTPPPPLPDPALDPAGPVSAPVDSTVTFQALNLTGAVDWSVNGVVGGTTAVGTIAAGTFTAPDRIPADATVTVAAAETADPTRSADAQVTITAQGTLYILETTVYVYNDMGETTGDVAADRTFTIDGAVEPYYDMAIAPAFDMGFLSLQRPQPNVYRVSSISAASGVVAGTALDTGTSESPSGLAYDQQRDILYVLTEVGLLVYDDASTAPAGTVPSRVVAGPNAEFLYNSHDARMSLDDSADRLFVSNPGGQVGVYDDVSTADGDQAPHRTILLDASIDFLWGSAYDDSRDELYLADQTGGVGVYVVADASTAVGSVAPSRAIGGPTYPLQEPSQIGYDVVNDRLVVIETTDGTVKVFDDASTVSGDVPATRVIGGAELPISYPYSGYLDPTQ
jgi:hypothetical protein